MIRDYMKAITSKTSKQANETFTRLYGKHRSLRLTDDDVRQLRTIATSLGTGLSGAIRHLLLLHRKSKE